MKKAQETYAEKILPGLLAEIKKTDPGVFRFPSFFKIISEITR